MLRGALGWPGAAFIGCWTIGPQDDAVCLPPPSVSPFTGTERLSPATRGGYAIPAIIRPFGSLRCSRPWAPKPHPHDDRGRAR
jgi:hypothetical protein